MESREPERRAEREDRSGRRYAILPAVQSALEGMTYPARKVELLRHVLGQEPSEEVMTLMLELPERLYQDEEDVARAVEQES